MGSALTTAVLALALTAPGGLHPKHRNSGHILPPGPGFGYGFPNGRPDGYGWYNTAGYLPIGADRTPEYYFPRYMAVIPTQLFLPTYFNSYESRGQRFIPYTNCGGWHPAGGPPPLSSHMPEHPGLDEAAAGPSVALPRYTGRVEAPPVNPGHSGLTP